MKSLVAAVALTASMGAFASEVCNDIPNPTRFMPTELSAYQECFLTEYKSDEQAGVLGSLAWVRLNGEYYSVQVKQVIRKAGTSQKFGEAFAELIARDVEANVLADLQIRAQYNKDVATSEAFDAVASGNLEVINGLRNEIAVAEAMLAAQSLDHAAAIDTLVSAHEAAMILAKASAYGAGKAAMQPHIDFLEDRLDRVATAAGYAGDTFYGSDGLIQHIKDMAWKSNKYEGLVAEVALLKGQVASASHHVRGLLADLDAVANASTIAPAGSMESAFSAHTGVDYGELDTNLSSSASIPGAPADGIGNATSSSLQINVGTSYSQSVSGSFHYAGDAMGETLSVLSIAVSDIQSAVETAYESGYNDGYEDGYADGYSDGFADGVESVQ